MVAENGALLYRPATGERKDLGEPPPDALVACLRASGMPLSVGHTIVATIRPHESVGAREPSPTSASSSR